MRLIVIAALLLAGCATAPTPPPVEKIVTRDVLVPYDKPCPSPVDIPPVPGKVAAEHPVMPAGDGTPDSELKAGHARERILAEKLLELWTYAERSNGVLKACAGVK